MYELAGSARGNQCGKQAGVHAKLKANPKRSAVPPHCISLMVTPWWQTGLGSTSGLSFLTLSTVCRPFTWLSFSFLNSGTVQTWCTSQQSAKPTFSNHSGSLRCKKAWLPFDFFDILIKGGYIHHIHRNLTHSVITQSNVIQLNLNIHVGDRKSVV